MARIFQTLAEAAYEIRRDIAKAPVMKFTRVQHHRNIDLPGRELVAYEYGIAEGGIPDNIDGLAVIGRELGFELFNATNIRDTLAWLDNEIVDRCYSGLSGINLPPTELNHPLLKSTIEGNHPSYTYRERLIGAVETMSNHLTDNPDSRRVYWPIYQPIDAIRAGQATRVPCSLGYQIVVRPVDEINRYIMIYMSRSCDFDRFWLSDVWLAHMFRNNVWQAASYNDLERVDHTGDDATQSQPGMFHHFVSSFHSFTVDSKEIY